MVERAEVKQHASIKKGHCVSRECQHFGKRRETVRRRILVMVAIMSLVLLILLWLRLWLLPLVQFFKSILFFRAVLGFNQN